ncbi:hypothetical protein [uncultured Roseibium sp.]|uniref:hypothetical protein n=1 Tax=uncultured Roseibium sp. TaxID=1936171 RepID=UPI002617E5A7|nr:hypothetical protein [uncultured Roseibium sp.]
MKKQRKNTNHKAKRTSAMVSHQPASETGVDRRGMLRLVRNVAIGAAVLGGTGYVFAQNVMTTMHEHDLDRVGNGVSTIVQIHDPQCSMCLALQRETRKALDMLEGRQIDYVVANIRTQKGREFANRYGAQHVTLLLFNEAGELQDIVQGQQGSYQLKDAFERLLAG